MDNKLHKELRLSITPRCNMRCVYCHNEGNINHIDNDMPLNRAIQIVEGAVKCGIKRVRITGGEPLVHNDIVEMCRIFKLNYNLHVGVNTNAMKSDTLLYLVANSLIDEVVVGMDYFDNNISKQSPVGKSSKEVKETILKIKKAGVSVAVDVVFDGDYENIRNFVSWSLTYEIPLRILEIVDLKFLEDTNRSEYFNMRDKVFADFKLKRMVDELNETVGLYNGKKMISFYHSFCKEKRCDLCHSLAIRINCKGIIKGCLISKRNDIDLFDGRSITDHIQSFMDGPSFDAFCNKL